MARKLPWAEKTESEPSRARTTNAQTSPAPASRGRQTLRQTHIKTPPSTPRKRKGSRTPSTSPPPGPPDAEPMIEGYDEDDIWMMVEDEFQTLAQSFTTHLHHAEYKRLMKKAKEAPRKELPEPTSPMSKETKRKLQRQARDISNKDVLDRMIGGARILDDADEEKVDDPWRGTALAGLISTSSQEKTSLKGLEKMPSSTRAAKGFSKAEAKDRTKKMDAIDLLTRPPEQRNEMKLSPSKPVSNRKHDKEDEDENAHRRPARKSTLDPPALNGNLSAGTETSKRRARDGPTVAAMPDSQSMPPPQLSKTMLPRKRKQVKEQSKEDRLAEVPMFLF